MTERQIVESNLRYCRAMGAIVRLTLRKLGVVEVKAPAVPGWFEACFEAYWKSTWHALPVLEDTEAPVASYDLGYFAGNARWYRHWVTLAVAQLGKLELPTFQLSLGAKKSIDDAWKNTLFPSEVKAELELAEGDEIHRFWKGVEESAESLAVPEASQFHSGKAQGLLGPSGSLDGELVGTDATAIYFMLMLWWPQLVEDAPPISAVHRGLVFLLGRNRAGNLHRLQKICERIGLKTRGRGRPKQNWPFPTRKKRKPAKRRSSA